MKMTFEWIQGLRKYKFGFINNHTLCIKSGPAIKFQNILTNETQTIQLPTKYQTDLSIHPLGSYYAITEINNVNPSIYVYNYPHNEAKILNGAGNLEIQQSIFSYSTYYAAVSGVPDFILSVWDFSTGDLICKTNLNGCHLTTFSFCPTDWRYLVGTDRRCIHVWQIETCGEMSLIRCNSLILPERSASLGMYSGLNSSTTTGEDTTSGHYETRFDPKLTESSITGLTENGKEEFDDYIDKSVRVNCVSQAWTNSELVFIGCESGQLLLFDPIGHNMKILRNPFSHSKNRAALDSSLGKPFSESDTNSIDFSLDKSDDKVISLPVRCLTHLLYTRYGVLAGGRDGILRLITLNINNHNHKTTNTSRINPSSKYENQSSMLINETLLNTEIVNCINLYEFDNPMQKGQFNWATNITNLCVTPSYERIAISSRLGHLNVFTLHDTPELSKLTLNFQILTNPDRFIGMGLIKVDNKTYCVTARNTGIINCWDCETGELIGYLFLNDRCYCLSVSPVLPLAVTGMNSGTIMFIDCTSPTSLRIVKVTRLYRKPLTHICFDTNGEYLTTAVDDGPSIVISALPTNSFEPIAHVSFTGKMNSLSIIRSKDSEMIYILLAVGNETGRVAETVYHYELPSNFENDQKKYLQGDCRRLKEDAIKLCKLQLDQPKTGVCFWPSFEMLESNNPLLIAADQLNHTLDLYKLTEKQKEENLAYIKPSYGFTVLSPSQNIKFARDLSNDLLLAYSVDGSVQVISINPIVTLLHWVNIHECNSGGVIAAEFYKNLNTLITCGSDGLLTKIKLNEEDSSYSKTSSSPNLKSFSEQLTSLKGMTDYKITTLSRTSSNVNNPINGQNLPTMMIRSSTAMTLDEQPMFTEDDITETESEIFSSYLENIDSHVNTWIEQCQIDVQTTEDLAYKDTKIHILNELNTIRKTVNAMVDENENLPEMQRIGRLEFELDSEEQSAILNKTKETVAKLREEIHLKDLGKQFVWQAIKNECWDDMCVKGRCLKAFSLPITVTNYPLKHLTSNDKRSFATVTARLKIIKAVEEERETLSAHLFQSILIKKLSPEQKEEVDDEEDEEKSINRILAGSTAKEFGGSTEQDYSQMELYTRMQKVYQIVLTKQTIHQMKECFNKEFNEVYEKKADQLALIRSKLSRIRKIHTDLQQTNALKYLIDPRFDQDEEPEQLLTVTDSEIKVEKYLSPEQLAEIEARRLAEEERRRREKLDNWRERGLEDMMGGVLEIKKEDQLKKDIPKPAFLLTGKLIAHWTEDDKRMYAEYERKVKELNEEREKYKKFLEGELKKIYGQIDEIKTKFDEQLTALFNKWISFQVALLQEELKVWRLKWMLITEEELITREYELRECIDELSKQQVQITENLEAAKAILEQVQEEQEILYAEDKIMEKNLRKEFADIHGPLYEFIAKAYKKRPKRNILNHSGKHTDRGKHETRHSTQHNPYIEKIWQSSQSMKLNNLTEGLDELDNDPSHEQQPGCDNALWHRLCASRRRKIYKEMEIKTCTQRLNDITTFVHRRENDLQSVNTAIETKNKQLTDLIEEYHRNQTDLELQLLVKQGFVEVNINPTTLLHDYDDALLVQREHVEELNKQIIALGESKVLHMTKSKDFKRRFYHLEWELREMLMHYEDLQNKLCDIKRFKITSEIQKYLHSNDYDALISTHIANTEHTIQMLRENHEKAMNQKLARLRRYEVQQSEKLKKENEKAKKDIEELNIALHETKFIHEQSYGKTDKLSSPSFRHKMLIQYQNIVRKIKEQSNELKVLRSELAILHQHKTNVF
uniref:Cilia- and flagella-associated protein 43 n=2 Tax=Trichobilharzia regenti TaxID=157069 RepID=A0AA85IRD5_TRIRE|nr:unnamed protein product [Trichobilharzia regenti]